MLTEKQSGMPGQEGNAQLRLEIAGVGFTARYRHD